MSSDYDPWPLADRVKGKESDRGLSVRAAARACGLPTSTYYEVSRGIKTPTAPTIRKLLRFSGMDLGSLLES